MLTSKQLEEEKIYHQETENGFWFAGRHTSEFNMYVEKRPVQKTAIRKRTAVSVPGRSGNLHYAEDAFENYEQPYECYFHGVKPMPNVAHEIKDWLQGDGGVHVLRDDYDSECFKMATFIGPMDIENTLNKYGRCTVIFDCAPQSYLDSGQEPVDFTQAGYLLNPTRRTAKPLIVVYGTGAGNLTVGNATVQIKALEDVIILDSELGDAYRQMGEGAPENKNSSIYAPEFPELVPGENAVSWDGGISSVRITPRWWTL